VTWTVFGVVLVSPALFQLATVLVAHESSLSIGRLARYGSFVAAVIGLLVLAWHETGSGTIDWVVRLVHLGAVALWLGGATWHNSVVAPTIRSNPDLGSALRAQARRFRRHLPVVIVAIFLTGTHQTVRLFGPALEPLLTTPLGQVVVGKLLLLAVLTGLVLVTLLRAQVPGDSGSDSTEEP